ncbi:hypothetical protein SUNI508_14080 [Seiridium unicorne]|uniref:Uncharacterized protein n=1 Tax=Seiridium unicorne TaxID=138068 RepID=A0ABR2V0X4_9PEZI
MAFVLKFLELPPQNQIHGERVVTRWGNRDCESL